MPSCFLSYKSLPRALCSTTSHGCFNQSTAFQNKCTPLLESPGVFGTGDCIMRALHTQGFPPDSIIEFCFINQVYVVRSRCAVGGLRTLLAKLNS